MDPCYRNPHLKPLGTSTFPGLALELIPLGVAEVNKLVRSHPSMLSYSNRRVRLKFGGNAVKLYVGDHTLTALRRLVKNY